MIEITGIKAGDHSIPVPPGLSDLVNQSNAWSIPDKKKLNEKYQREVVMEGGKIITILSLKANLKKEA